MCEEFFVKSMNQTGLGLEPVLSTPLDPPKLGGSGVRRKKLVLLARSVVGGGDTKKHLTNPPPLKNGCFG